MAGLTLSSHIWPVVCLCLELWSSHHFSRVLEGILHVLPAVPAALEKTEAVLFLHLSFLAESSQAPLASHGVGAGVFQWCRPTLCSLFWGVHAPVIYNLTNFGSGDFPRISFSWTTSPLCVLYALLRTLSSYVGVFAKSL